MTSVRTLKGLCTFLQENGLAPQKRSSQNFLIDKNILDKIIQEAAITKEDLVIEIGSGPGALTEALLETGCQVWAIEKDQAFARLLHRLEKMGRLTVFAEDFLSFPLEEQLTRALPHGKKAKIVANLPYHITTPILAKLVPLHTAISDLIIMLQKEVAERCLAICGTKDYGSLSLFLQFFCQITYGFTVSSSCFYPRPSVQSSVIHLCLQPPPTTANQSLVFTLIRSSFQKRRKMITTSWKELFPLPLLLQVLTDLGISPSSRPEDLSLDNFIALADALAANQP
ncbi:MAG: ribosomal RNA small subunit methyltransferase A [Chlamydiae bacterium]|nr:ribosomal RNA small subunit methyltransferase A [Chlamydiota bacterium]